MALQGTGLAVSDRLGRDAQTVTLRREARTRAGSARTAREGAPCGSETSPTTDAAAVRQAARRRAHPRRSSRCRRSPTPPSCSPASAPTWSRSSPRRGESGRGSQPAMLDPDGRIGRRHVPAQQPRQAQRRASTSRARAGRDLVLAPRAAVRRRRRELQGRRAWTASASATTTSPRVHPAVDLRVGLGLRQPRRLAVRATGPRTRRSPRPCRASTSSRADRRRAAACQPRRRARRHQLRAVRGRSASSPRCATATRTGEGQHVDVAMYDATVAMTDIVTNFGSLGIERLADPAP